MRILFLLTQDLDSPSGLGRYRPLAEGLARRGHHVRVAALHSNFEQLKEKRFSQNGVHIEYVAPMHVRKTGNQKTYYPTHQLLWLSLHATFALARAALADPSVEIIHIGKPHPMNSLAGWIAARSPFRRWGRGRGPRLLLDRDDYEIGVNRFGAGWQRWVIGSFERLMPRLVDHITTNTHFTEDLIRQDGCPAEKITYISNGFDRARFQAPGEQRLAELRAQLGLGSEAVVLFLGSLSLAGHPVDLLLRAFALLRQRLPRSDPQTGPRLLIVGGGEDYDTLQNLAQELGIGPACVFSGRVAPDQAVAYYHLAAVSVDPVHDDQAARGRSPLKLFESWACGIPFVSADVGDRRQLVTDLAEPAAGLLARPGDPASLADCIEQVLYDAGLAASLRARGLEKAGDYDWDKLTHHLERLYRLLLTGKRMDNQGAEQPNPPAPQPAQVWTIIVNWRRLEDTLACARSVLDEGLAQENLVLVDNGSQDGSAASLAAHFPRATLVTLPENLGFAGGYNAGIRAALQAGAQQLFILNNDTTVEPGSIQALAASGWDVAVPKVVYFDEPGRIWAAGSRWRVFPPSITMIGLNRVDGPAYARPYALQFATGCALLLRRQVAEHTGGFDPLYENYMEDYDFFVRLRQAGFSAGYVPEACIRHKVSRSLGEHSAARWRYLGRNTVLLYRQRLKTSRLTLWSFLAWFSLRETLKGYARLLPAYWQGVREGYQVLAQPDQPGRPG